MAAAELEQVRKLLTAVPFDAAQPVAAARAGIDALGDSFVIPAGVKSNRWSWAARRGAVDADVNGPVLLYLHGGGYVIGSPKSHRHVTGLLAQRSDGVVLRSTTAGAGGAVPRGAGRCAARLARMPAA